jgi:hypothetical protein
LENRDGLGSGRRTPNYSVELLLKQLSDIAARHRRDAMSFHAKDVSTAFRDTSSFMAAGKIET